MSSRLLLILALFVVAQGCMTMSRAAFLRALAAANAKLPAGDAMTPRDGILRWRSVRRTLRRFEDASKALTQSDFWSAGGVALLLGMAVYVVATWNEA